MPRGGAYTLDKDGKAKTCSAFRPPLGTGEKDLLSSLSHLGRNLTRGETRRSWDARRQLPLRLDFLRV